MKLPLPRRRGASVAAFVAGIAVVAALAVAPMQAATAAVACATPWSSSAVYTAGATVSHESVNYSAKWWTQNNVPGAEQWGPWELVKAC